MYITSQSNQKFSNLQKVFEQESRIVFGFLFGSQATGDCKNPGDWDFAVFWTPELDFWEKSGRVEDLRSQLAKTLETSLDQVDLLLWISRSAFIRQKPDRTSIFTHFIHHTSGADAEQSKMFPFLKGAKGGCKPKSTIKNN
jgi:hypothetical protein